MCDVKKYNEFAKEFMNMDISDFSQLIVEAENLEMRKFYMNMHSFFLQERQKEVIKENVF